MRPAEPGVWEENAACREKGLGGFFRAHCHLSSPAGYSLLPGTSQLQDTLEIFRWSYQALPSFSLQLEGEAQHRKPGGSGVWCDMSRLTRQSPNTHPLLTAR